MPEKPQRKKQAKIRRPSEEDILHLRRTGRYIPPPRKNWRDRLIVATKTPLKLVEKRLIEPLANLVDRADLFRILEKVGFLIALLVFLLEFGERREKSIFEAWDVVKDGKDQKSGVVRLALERLRKEEFSLSGIDVKGSNLSEIELGCNYTIKNLSVERVCTDLSSANLSDANLRGASLSYAMLGNAQLYSANLWNADLSYANLGSANLSSAYLGGADIRDANLRSANLSSANLRRASLSYANLSDADIRDANLSYANLSSANLRGANLSGADIRDANLSGAQNLTPEQVKSAKNWEEAKYDEEFRAKLGLPPEPAKKQGE